jgi:hypothetical protein
MRRAFATAYRHRLEKKKHTRAKGAFWVAGRTMPPSDSSLEDPWLSQSLVWSLDCEPAAATSADFRSVALLSRWRDAARLRTRLDNRLSAKEQSSGPLSKPDQTKPDRQGSARTRDARDKLAYLILSHQIRSGASGLYCHAVPGPPSGFSSWSLKRRMSFLTLTSTVVLQCAGPKAWESSLGKGDRNAERAREAYGNKRRYRLDREGQHMRSAFTRYQSLRVVRCTTHR